MLHDRAEYEKNIDHFWDNCPFCDLELQADQIIWRGKYWYVQHNKYPYL